MAKAFNLQATLGKADDRARDWADRIGDTARDQHRNSPRGGSNLNKYGQPRSAPGEPPAVEDGDLLALLSMPAVKDGSGWEAPVNYRVLETGTARVEPRPNGRIALSAAKVRAKTGVGP